MFSRFEKLRQILLAAACSENDHSSDPLPGLCTWSHTSSYLLTAGQLPDATLKTAPSALETSPAQLALCHGEQECCQASYVLQQSHFGRRQSSMVWRGLTSCQLPGGPLKSHWNKLTTMWTAQNGNVSKYVVAAGTPPSNWRCMMNSEQGTSGNVHYLVTRT